MPARRWNRRRCWPVRTTRAPPPPWNGTSPRGKRSNRDALAGAGRRGSARFNGPSVAPVARHGTGGGAMSMDPEQAQEVAERDQLWASLRALRPEIDRLARGDLVGDERDRQLVLLLARIVLAE